MNCSIGQSLEVVGEWWSLLIIRDAFLGVTRFDDFQERLGIARNVLNQRLSHLVDEGVFERVAYNEHPPASTTSSPNRAATCGQWSSHFGSGATAGEPRMARPSSWCTVSAATSRSSSLSVRTVASRGPHRRERGGRAGLFLDDLHCELRRSWR